MRYSSSEKMVIIQIVEDSELSISLTLKGLVIPVVLSVIVITVTWKMAWRTCQGQNLLAQDSGGSKRTDCL
jgi:hypothetical protein